MPGGYQRQDMMHLLETYRDDLLLMVIYHKVSGGSKSGSKANHIEHNLICFLQQFENLYQLIILCLVTKRSMKMT
jgi:hypothetical protein